MKANTEYDIFSNAMSTILKANPSVVKSAMETERLAREEETKRTGKRGRGRPSKASYSGNNYLDSTSPEGENRGELC